MEIRKVSVSKMNPAAYNPRKNLQPNDPEYQKLARSMDKFGCVEPIVWNERTGNVVGGHQRLKVLIAAGEKELDVSVVNLSEADEKALNIALNKISGEWDDIGLSKLLQELSETVGIDETLTGFDSAELDELLDSLNNATKDFELSNVDPYVDSFFESGAQEKSKQQSRSETNRVDLTTEQETASACSCVMVYNLTPDSLETLTAYLTEKSFTYRLEAGGA